MHPPGSNPPAWTWAAIYASTLFAVAIPLKIWNNTRNEKKLEEQERLLVEARLAALTSQINPHFLFNTLNSVSSLIRTNPNQARTMVVKLSAVLRRLLRKHAWRPALVPIITVIGLQIAMLLGGAVLTETTFEWKGLGFQLVQYLLARDFVAVQGMVALLAVIVAVTNFVVDVIAALVDPRIRY